MRPRKEFTIAFLSMMRLFQNPIHCGEPMAIDFHVTILGLGHDNCMCYMQAATVSGEASVNCVQCP